MPALSQPGDASSVAPTAGDPPRPLRVLVVAARDPRNPRAAGGDLHLSLLALELVRAGHTVRLWCCSSPGLPPVETREGVEVERLAPTRLLAPFVWVRFLIGRAAPYDLVVEEVIGGERTPFLGILLAGRPCVGMWYQDNRPLFRAAYGPAAARLAGVVQSILVRVYRAGFLLTPSERTRAWLIGSGISADHIAIHQPKVLALKGPDGSRPFGQRRNRFICLGNFRPYKRFDEAVSVLEALRAELPDAELVMMGRKDDPSYLASLERRVRDSKWSAGIELRTNVSDAEKFDTLLTAKALTIHSPIEGFGWTIPEAGLCGVPTVANEGTPPEPLEEGVSGVRVRSGDVGAYARTLKEWMTDELLWKRFSDGALRRARRFLDSGLRPEIDAFLRRTVREWRRRGPATPATEEARNAEASSGASPPDE
ncbi:MAG: glycosyltransferase [Thermoplasmata archaeon]|nr:glycosyltransferase [Thermoplasmata archaeon]